ncbi:hypothetical protein DCAR_0102019 [Daucus carota subsp. sativus]|uniref:Uncharacterized protein n=1 Tax=Daucus carota subsp. sativus TaxID=79200 RepID=A0AAF0W431_DAUCS|nr:hypothetical protein DCAR_0102019 [Daucus carota subsp. sativus]
MNIVRFSHMLVKPIIFVSRIKTFFNKSVSTALPTNINFKKIATQAKHCFFFNTIF